MKQLRAIVMLVVCGALVSAQGQQSGLVEWPYWGGDPANTRYTSLPDITPANVNQLERAWEWNTKEMPLAEYGTRPGPFENTPIMIDNVL